MKTLLLLAVLFAVTVAWPFKFPFNLGDDGSKSRVEDFNNRFNDLVRSKDKEALVAQFTDDAKMAICEKDFEGKSKVNLYNRTAFADLIIGKKQAYLSIDSAHYDEKKQLIRVFMDFAWFGDTQQEDFKAPVTYEINSDGKILFRGGEIAYCNSVVPSRKEGDGENRTKSPYAVYFFLATLSPALEYERKNVTRLMDFFAGDFSLKSHTSTGCRTFSKNETIQALHTYKPPSDNIVASIDFYSSRYVDEKAGIIMFEAKFTNLPPFADKRANYTVKYVNWSLQFSGHHQHCEL